MIRIPDFITREAVEHFFAAEGWTVRRESRYGTLAYSCERWPNTCFIFEFEPRGRFEWMLDGAIKLFAERPGETRTTDDFMREIARHASCVDAWARACPLGLDAGKVDRVIEAATGDVAISAPLKLTERHVHVMRHALGLDNSKKSYRNGYHASEGHSSWQELMDLVALGLMEKAGVGGRGSSVFVVTPAGKLLCGGAA